MIRKIKLTDFVRNVLTLTTGTTVAQAIPVLITPVLTRLYTPADFGLLTLFVSLTSLLTVVVTGQYELSILLPGVDRDARKLVRLALMLTVSASILLLLLVLLLHAPLLTCFKDKRIGFWLYLVPVAVLFSGVFEILRYYSVRQQAYKGIAVATVIRSGTAGGLQVAAGMAGAQAAGLLWGNLLSLLGGNLGVIRVYLKKKEKEEPFRITPDLRRMAWRYRNFPKFTLPSLLLNTASLQLPVYVFATFFSNTVVGFYALSQRVLNAPMTLVGAAIGQVYFQKAASGNGDKEQLRQLTWALYKHLLLLGTLPMAALLFWGDKLFGWFFGSSWTVAGQYAQSLSLWFLFVFISSPLSNLFFVQGKQKQGLLLQVIIFVSRALVLLLCLWRHYDAAATVVWFGAIGALIFFCFVFYLLSSAGIGKLQILVYTLAVLAAGILPFFLIDQWLS
ncbi:lipopolysaccharide biosynthesis protein [Taibaiella koreensis]|uniref:lipopolysaccharide biosynthesis protein n=1 Tax=Taibaiella koreensis TaxID=1268548 RepID=UPI000E59CC18|nr:lipopolysaccharide biosynthesis protein [Taibaiella koreensis]